MFEIILTVSIELNIVSIACAPKPAYSILNMKEWK